MNSELRTILDQITEFSGKILLKKSEENLATGRALIAKYVEILLRKTATQDARNILAEPRDNILHIAAKFGDLMSMTKVLEFLAASFGKASDGHDLKFYTNVRDDDSFTPIHHAAKNGWVEIVKILLENGANVSPKSSPKDREWMPIHYAAKSGHVDVVKILIENRADKEAKTSFGLTPLLVGAEFGHLKVVQFLLVAQVKKDVKTIETNHCMNALHYAAIGGFADVTLALLQAGIDKELKTTSGSTALHFAISSANVEVVRILLVNRVNGNVKTPAGHDALYIAASKGRKEIVSLLLQWGIGDIEESIKIAKRYGNQEIIAELEIYQKAIKQLFASKNLPENLGSILKSYTKETLADCNIRMENGVSFNAYGILNLKQKAGIFSKEKVSLEQAAEKIGNNDLSNGLMFVEKLTLAK